MKFFKRKSPKTKSPSSQGGKKCHCATSKKPGERLVLADIPGPSRGKMLSGSGRTPCAAMIPSMETRMRYISHCTPHQPAKAPDFQVVKAYRGVVFSSSDEEEGKPRRRRVRYKDEEDYGVILPRPVPVLRHTASNATMLNVPSPKISGEVIAAARATVKPSKVVPPIPSTAGYKLFKPHSGIILNADKDFVLEETPVPGGGAMEDEDVSGLQRRRKPPCCRRKNRRCPTCRRKECMLHAARLRRLRRVGKCPGGGSRKYHQHKDDDDACGVDEIPKPEHVQIPCHLKKGAFETHSLTIVSCPKERRPDIYYGIVAGTFNMYDTKFSAKSRGRQALPVSVMAYCLAFHYHPKQWTGKLIDNLMDAGDQWYLQCLDKVHDHSSIQGMCEVLPFSKKQALVLNGKRMQVLLGEPEIVGYTMSVDPTVYNLCRGLKAYFKDHRAGILLTRVLKVVVWKDKICYYIFDSAGRDSKGYSNFAAGGAALINVRDLASVAEILLARSVLDDQKFVLASLKVLKMIDEKCDEDFESDKELTHTEKSQMGYRILDANSAIVNANMHIGDRCFEEARFRQAIPIAVIAMTYAKISPPNTWYTRTIDKILRLGNKLYVDCQHPRVMIDMTIDNIPNEIEMGPYACEIIIYRERTKGQLFICKDCFLNIKSGLDEFFNNSYNSGILQFSNYALAVWKQKEMYYLFDPYPRTPDGKRAQRLGRACCWMFLNPEAMAIEFRKNWDYLPITTQFCIHAFKVLKICKREPKDRMVCMCTLSDEKIAHYRSRSAHSSRRRSRASLFRDHSGGGHGHLGCASLDRDIAKIDRDFDRDLDKRPDRSSDRRAATNLDHDFDGDGKGRYAARVDEEQMGDIVSLVDSIQEDYVPRIPKRYRNYKEEELEPKVVNLDSPTVSVTQVVPPWPTPRDKSNELPEPDPDREPTPPPTPPPPPPPEGGEEEEEEEDAEDEEAMQRKLEEEERRRAEEEEARRKAEELPEPMPPPPPTPTNGSPTELELAQLQAQPLCPEMEVDDEEEEMEAMEPAPARRRILLTEDARNRYNRRKQRRRMTQPLAENPENLRPEQELAKPNNFKDLPDNSQIIRGTNAIGEDKGNEVLPFASIVAIVISYKYMISTWTRGIVTFIVDTANKLYASKKDKFQMAPLHIIPRFQIGHQAYSVTVEVVAEGPSWQLEKVLDKKFLRRHDRGILTTASYSCAFFERNCLYYLFDGTHCNAMGIRDTKDTKGKACFLRFKTLHDLVSRMKFNKDGNSEDQHFILSKLVVRRLEQGARYKLPEDYDYETQMPKSKKSRASIVKADTKEKSAIEEPEPRDPPKIGYQKVGDAYKIEGSTGLTGKKPGTEVKACHFACLMAMLMATMHPIRTWDHIKVDGCIEKGLEIYGKATNLCVCEKRVIKNVLLDGKFINVNIKKILVVNNNTEKTVEQYVNAVLKRLRYFIIKFDTQSMVVCHTDGYYHLFDPYEAEHEKTPEKKKTSIDSTAKAQSDAKKTSDKVASWTLYKSRNSLNDKLDLVAGKNKEPEFYTFELTSIKPAPRHAAINYRLSPLFRPDENPNYPFLKRRKLRPIVDEKMYWRNIEQVPWSRMIPYNDLGCQRKTAKTLWNEWDIEFPGDLYSLWGKLHPKDERFPAAHRGKQYLATSVLGVCMVQAVKLSAWTSPMLDAVVTAGDEYHRKCAAHVGNKPNYEILVTDLDQKFDQVFPFTFAMKFDNVIFGFVYNIQPDRFNLSKALTYFFEKHNLGILTSSAKNLGFGRRDGSYFMFDCQTYGAPVFVPGQGAAYMLKCESLNRLIYCITITLDVKRHGQQFNLYSVVASISEKDK